MLSFVNSLTGRTTVSTASILFFPSLLPILYTLSFSFLPATAQRRKNTEKLQTDEILSRVLCKTCFLTSKKHQNKNNSKEVTPVFFFPLFLHRPLLFTVVSSCSMELPSSRSRRISAHLRLSREEMRKNVVQRSKSLLGQGD